MSEDIVKLDIGKTCKIEFDKNGNIKIGKDCTNAIINPVELAILDRSNKDRGAR